MRNNSPDYSVFLLPEFKLKKTPNQNEKGTTTHKGEFYETSNLLITLLS